MSAPYTLYIHLIGGHTVELPCETFGISPPTVDADGAELPMRIDYTPVAGWQRGLSYLDFRAVAAIEVERSEVAIATEG